MHVPEPATRNSRRNVMRRNRLRPESGRRTKDVGRRISKLERRLNARSACRESGRRSAQQRKPDAGRTMNAVPVRKR